MTTPTPQVYTDDPDASATFTVTDGDGGTLDWAPAEVAVGGGAYSAIGTWQGTAPSATPGVATTRQIKVALDTLDIGTYWLYLKVPGANDFKLGPVRVKSRTTSTYVPPDPVGELTAVFDAVYVRQGVPFDEAAAAVDADDGSAFRTQQDARLMTTFVGRPTAAEQIVYVSPRGNDFNDGLTLQSARATLLAAVDALGGEPGMILVGAGTTTESETLYLPSGTMIIGAGRGVTTLEYTGSETFIKSADAGTSRAYNVLVADLFLDGPGSGTSTIGIDFTDVSSGIVRDVGMNGFGIGFKNAGNFSGWSVYNDLTNVFFTSCGIGADHQLLGSNGARYRGCKFGACTIGANIVDSNQNSFQHCQFEGNGTGIFVDATVSGRSDHNVFRDCRFEGNAISWVVNSANVRSTKILDPAIFGAYAFTDNGSRTKHTADSSTIGWSVKSVAALATGCWRYERVANGGSGTPALVVVDGVTSSGTPVTYQAETERILGSFYRGVRGATVYYDVRADGIVTKTGDITPFLTKTSSYSARAGSTSNPADGTIVCNGAAVTISLPDPTTTAVGQRYTVKNINAASATVNSAGTLKTLDGAASQSLAQWAKASYISDGAQWLTI